MSRYNPLPYISLPFVLLWRIIRESDTKKSKIIFTIISLLLLLLGIWLLFLWHRVPSYYHSVYVEKVYAQDSLVAKETSLNYTLFLSNNGYITHTDHKNKDFKFKKLEEYVFHLDSDSKNQFEIGPYRKTCEEVGDFSDIIDKGAGLALDSVAKRYGIHLCEYKYGIYAEHQYGDDMHSCSPYKYTLCEDTTECWGITVSQEAGTISDSSFFKIKENYRYSNWGKSDSKTYLMAFFSKAEYNNSIRWIYTPPLYIIKNKIMKFFELHDLSKAEYHFSFASLWIDKATFIIAFDENVSFSESNIEPKTKDRVSITFEGSTMLKHGTSFYVEFVDSSNLQNIRVILLTALLSLPLGLFLKNLYAIIKSL